MAKQVKFVLGNEAIVEGALAAGADFYAGYPITPSSEVAEECSKRLPLVDGTYMQMEDEIGSMAAIIGASLAGAQAFTATSGPGFSLMQENLGLAYMAEVPCVVINVMRSGPSTGLATRPAQADVMQAKWGTHGDFHPVVFCASTVQQCYELMYAAFFWAERLRMPVIFLTDEVIGHLREGLELDESLPPIQRRWPECPPEEYLPYRAGPDGVPHLAAFGSDYVFHVTGSMHGENGFPTSNSAVARAVIRRLTDKVLAARGELAKYTKLYECDSPGSARRVLLVAYGSTARAARYAAEALSERGVSARVLEPNVLWPFPDDRLREAARDADLVVVPEMNLGQIVWEVKRLLPAWRVLPVNRSDGEPLTPEQIQSAIRGCFDVTV